MAILNHPQQQPVPHHPIPKQEPPPHPAPPHKAGPDRGKMSDDQNNALKIHNQAVICVRGRSLSRSPTSPLGYPLKFSLDHSHSLLVTDHFAARTDAIHYFGHPRGDLVWDDQLAANATAYARRLASANQGLHHSDGNGRPNQGENLYWSKPNGSLADASTGWVNEQKSYHGEKIGEGDFGSYGHYTQVRCHTVCHTVGTDTYKDRKLTLQQGDLANHD
ncbi:MAG: hypothetical protein LQ338_008262 [Usnochroma carphineum]|nr:MAG: hypothetical protein LQ338_008262 [Usnochroma carphineum]